MADERGGGNGNQRGQIQRFKRLGIAGLKSPRSQGKTRRKHVGHQLGVFHGRRNHGLHRAGDVACVGSRQHGGQGLPGHLAQSAATLVQTERDFLLVHPQQLRTVAVDTHGKSRIAVQFHDRLRRPVPSLVLRREKIVQYRPREAVDAFQRVTLRLAQVFQHVRKRSRELGRLGILAGPHPADDQLHVALGALVEHEKVLAIVAREVVQELSFHHDQIRLRRGAV
jgi:hypothetical protein